MATKYQKLIKQRDDAVQSVVDADMTLAEIETKLEVAERDSKIVNVDLKNVDQSAERRAQELSRVLVLRDMLDKAKEAHAQAQQAAKDAYDAVARAEYERAELDIMELFDELVPIVHTAHETIRDMALCYHKMLDRQPMASTQSPLDQMLNDILEIARSGEGYAGSNSHRDVNTSEKIRAFYNGKLGSEYGLKVHTHMSANTKWHQAPRYSEQYKKGLHELLDQRAKRQKGNTA